MRTWREVRNFASQKFRLTPGQSHFQGFVLAPRSVN